MQTAVLLLWSLPRRLREQHRALHIHELSGKTHYLSLCVCMSSLQLSVFGCMILVVTAVYGSVYESALVTKLRVEN